MDFLNFFFKYEILILQRKRIFKGQSNCLKLKKLSEKNLFLTKNSIFTEFLTGAGKQKVC